MTNDLKVTNAQMTLLRETAAREDGRCVAIGFPRASITKLVDAGLLIEGYVVTDREERWRLKLDRDLMLQRARRVIENEWRDALTTLQTAAYHDDILNRTGWFITPAGRTLVNAS